MTLTSPSQQIENIRSKAVDVLAQLKNQSDQEFAKSLSVKETTYRSWVRGRVTLDDGETTTERGADDEIGAAAFAPDIKCRYFDRNGFLKVDALSSTEEIEGLKRHMSDLVEDGWEPDRDMEVFRTDKGQTRAQGDSDYFLDSATRVHFFAETEAVNEDGSLKDEYRCSSSSASSSAKIRALNKAGHALHLPDNVFRAFASSTKVRTLVEGLGWRDPVVPQSMYIFKNPLVGGPVSSHQDSTFLYTTPRQSCLGLWLALDDATLDNGCLWVRPRSHWEPLRRRFVRNDAYFAKGDATASKMIFETLHESDEVSWEGSFPGGGDDVTRENRIDAMHRLLDAGFVPLECRAGDAFVFNGALDHLSLPNWSDQQRHTFQLHMVEGEGAGFKWAESNYLQYPETKKFFSLIHPE